MIEPDNSSLSIRQQCELLDINRSTLYYTPMGYDEYTIKLMRLIDEQFTKTPFYGVPRMTACLQRFGHQINHKRIERLYRIMGLATIYPKKNLSKRNLEHKIYPYLLRGIEIKNVNQVWSTDITYIRLSKGFVYLVAIIDWYSRYIVDWQLSITLESYFCVETLNRALKFGRCEIFNTDQGSQFTSPKFTDILLEHAIKISMDGRGRALDNIFIERFWRAIKYELIYLMELNTVAEARGHIGQYMEFYNNERPHQSLNYKTPAEIYLNAVNL